MRLDKFLKVSRLIKRRTVANEACDAGRVLINGRTAKASAAVKAGDVIEIQFGTKAVKVEVLDGMDEKQAQGTAHRVMIQGRHSGTISGVSDVLSFDLNEIVLQTTQGMLMIRGQELHMNRLTLEKGEVDIEGKIDSFVYSEQKGENGKDTSFLGRLFR